MTNIANRRFLFTCAGGYGHLHPLIPLARALQEAGHTVAFAESASWQPMLEAAGFEVLSLPNLGMREDAEYQQFKAELAAMPTNLESEIVNYNRVFIGISTRLRTPKLIEIARTWQPDMFIREAGEYAAVIAAEKLGLPHAVVAFAAALKGMAVFEQDAASRLDPIRRQWGLPADPDLAALYRYLCLSYSPPGFSLQEVGFPGPTTPVAPTTHFIKPTFFDQAEGASLPDWMAQMPPQPTVYLTLGTEVNKEPEFYPSVLQKIIAWLRDAPINLIVTLGRDKDPADFGPQPPNVHIERYIPQSLLLRHCDLMVMHGGTNTLLEAFDLGLPLIVVPLIADQFFNANIVQRLGAGQVVELENLTPERIRQALDDVLNNPSYRQASERLQAEMQALPGQEYAVKLVEQVATERKRILNEMIDPNLE